MIDGTIYIYYASSDTRMHVATSTIQQLTDYVPSIIQKTDCALRSSVATIVEIIDKNKSFVDASPAIVKFEWTIGPFIICNLNL
jgi:4-O-beta-D-mannosyl-D-glucose phosphorylase